MAALASHLGPTERDRALGEALKAAWTIGTDALAALVPHLAEPWLRGALEAAWGIGDEKARSRALAALAPRLVELGHPAKALEAARAIGDAWERSLALAALAPPLGPTERDRALGEALEKARSRALAALVPHLTEPWLREALEAARAIYGEGERSWPLAELAPRPGEARPSGRGAGGGAGHLRRQGPVLCAGRAGFPSGADRAGPNPRRGAGGGAGHHGRAGTGSRHWPRCLPT